MTTKETIEQTILRYPICEYTFGDTKDLVFSEKVREICRTDCERYGHSWSCPPFCGEIEDTMKKCRQYRSFCLFSTVAETEGVWNKEADLRVKKSHEEITRAIRKELTDLQDDLYVLSSGCTICAQCTCPDAPCRFPDERLSSMESHGILIIQSVEQAGLTMNFEEGAIVYFSLILFDRTDADKKKLSVF